MLPPGATLRNKFGKKTIYTQKKTYTNLNRIYNHYILNTTITFEEAKLSTPDIEKRIKTIRKAKK